MRRPASLLPLLALAAVTGCGGADRDAATEAPSTASTTPALARPARAPGEIVIRADGSPVTKGPYTFQGAYTVRFEQYAPEDPRLDFGAQTPFTASLVEHADGAPDPAKAVKLFERAARVGRTTIRARGRLDVDVSFGDFPFVVRFTPVGDR